MSGIGAEVAGTRSGGVHDTTLPRRRTALLVLLVAPFMAMLDMFIVNIAAPSIQTQLHTSFGAVQLVISGYIVAFAVGLITGGRVGDMWGRGRMYLWGMVGFGAASVLCAAAVSAQLLIVARVVQGLCAALMLPQVLALIQLIFPPEERGRVLGFYGATLSVGSISGQVLGGLLLRIDSASIGWRAIFLVNIPFCAVALTTGLRALPRGTPSAARPGFDPVGVLLMSLGVPALLCPLIFGAQYRWPWWVWPVLAASLAVFALFGRWEARFAANGGSALLPPRLFALPGFSYGLPTAVAFYSGNSGFYLVLAYFFQDGLHLTPFTAALEFVPLGTAFALASLASRILVPRFGRRALLAGVGSIVLGLLLLALGTLATGDALERALWLQPGLLLCGAGQGLVLPSLLGLILRGVGAEDAGSASGGILTSSQVAGALGVAGVGAAFSSALGDADYSRAFQVGLFTLAAIGMLSMMLLARLESRTRD